MTRHVFESAARAGGIGKVVKVPLLSTLSGEVVGKAMVK